MLGRDARDPATRHWKGYKGGARGELWLDLTGAGAFRRVAFAGFERDAPGSFGDVATTTDTSVLSALNVGDAAWASRDVVALVADDGSGRANLCSFRVPPESEDPTAADPTSPIEVTLVKHTARRDFCVRHLALDAAAVARGDATVTAVYASGGRLFASELGTELDVADGAAKGSAKNNKTRSRSLAGREIELEWRGAEAQCERFRLESPDDFVDDVSLHPEGLTVVATARGRAFAMGLWDGPAIELEPPSLLQPKSANTPNANQTNRTNTSLISPPGSDVLFAIASGEIYETRETTNGSGSGSVSERKNKQKQKKKCTSPYTSRESKLYASRARMAAYLWDATRVAIVRDANGEDDVEIHWEDGSRDAVTLNIPPAILGRPLSVVASPEAPLLAIVNHRAELLVVDCDTGDGKHDRGRASGSEGSSSEIAVARLADHSRESNGIRHVTWSPCGCWLAYTWHETAETSKVRVLDVRSGIARDATAPILNDSSPAWDPAGDYLYFLSSRELEPAYDAARFGLSFQGSEKPHCVALRKDVRNPLLRELRPPHDGGSSSSDSDDDDETSDDSDDDSDDDSSTLDAPPPIEIEFEGIFDRVVALPMPAGRYAHVLGLDDAKFCVVAFPNRRPGRVGLDAPYYAGEDSDDGSEDDEDGAGSRGGALLKFDMGSLKTSVLVEEGVKHALLSMDRRCVLLRARNASPGYADEYRCYKAGSKPEDEDSDGEEVDFDAHDRRSGLIDLESRLDQIVVTPRAEWRQMLCESWRVLRDEWWDENMAPGDAAVRFLSSEGGKSELITSGTFFADASDHASDHARRWTECLKKYARDVLPRAAARSEVNDVFAELGAELRSSHVALGLGDASGETRRRLNATPGRLGCDTVWDSALNGYRITSLVTGDAWDALAGGALVKPGVNVEPGDALLKINGRRLTMTRGVSDALVGCGGKEVSLTFLVGSRDKKPHHEGGQKTEGGYDANEAANDMRDLRFSPSPRETNSRTFAPSSKKKRADVASGGEKLSSSRHQATRGGESKNAKHCSETHPRFVPNPAAARPTFRRTPGTVVTVRVRAMHSELDARYRDLIATRAARVAALSGDAVGYLHVPDMERFGYGEFWRRFPRESRKGALIVDLRGNCGGHISELLLAKLAQRPLAFDVPRRGAPTAYPSHAAGFVVTLVDRDTGSDAELAAHAFRDAGLGPIVGTRTWGGLLTVAGGSTSLVDGGYVSFPSQNVVAFEKTFGNALGSRPRVRARGGLRGPGNAVENRGVEPDVVVTTSPSQHRAGEDPQLDAATREALALLRRRHADDDDSETEKEDADEDEKTPADVARRDAALAAAARRDGSGTESGVSGSSGGGGGVSKRRKSVPPGGKPETRVPSWPFRVFAPYPEAFDSESDVRSDESDESESGDDRGRRGKKPKGASRRR